MREPSLIAYRYAQELDKKFSSHRVNIMPGYTFDRVVVQHSDFFTPLELLGFVRRTSGELMAPAGPHTDQPQRTRDGKLYVVRYLLKDPAEFRLAVSDADPYGQYLRLATPVHQRREAA